jgi:hypothetical protein
MKSEISLFYSQLPPNFPCSEPDEASPHPPILLI